MMEPEGDRKLVGRSQGGSADDPYDILEQLLDAQVMVESSNIVATELNGIEMSIKMLPQTMASLQGLLPIVRY